MTKSEICAHGRKAPPGILQTLHDNQGGRACHKCVLCAYDVGFEAGLAKRMGILSADDGGEAESCVEGSAAPKAVLEQLPTYQGGSGRHKCAYKQGYETGLSQKQLEPGDVPPEFSARLKPFPDVDDESLSAKEGRRRWVQHFRRERNASIVNAKKAQVLKKTGRLKCEACEFDFRERYGALGENFSEAHHVRPLSTLREGEETKLSDLAILCSNCHRMIHRTKPIMSVADFKRLLQEISEAAE
jgi:hypothetical protein